MKIIKPSYEILTPIDRVQILKHIELCGRVCYKSEEKMTEDSASGFVSMIQNRNHESVLEHFSISVRFICNRGFTHELVRHRIASFSQESTRYCNYSKDKFGNEITVIEPAWFENDMFANSIEGRKIRWADAMKYAEKCYFDLIEAGMKPQYARGVLPIDLKTEIVITANLREWKHIFKLRNSKAAHPSMQELMGPLQEEFHKNLPEIF